MVQEAEEDPSGSGTALLVQLGAGIAQGQLRGISGNLRDISGISHGNLRDISGVSQGYLRDIS